MRSLDAPRYRRRWLVTGLAVTTAAAAVVTFMLQDHRPGHEAAPVSAPTSSPAGPAPSSSDDDAASDGGAAPVSASSDPLAFAASVAEALFAWDTATGLQVGDYRGRLLVVADPTGVESPGLVSDLDAYLPDAAAWTRLAEYSTHQWLDVDSAAVPTSWESLRADAPAGAITPGTTAVTVTGTRHRAGVWNGEAVTSESDVAFTVFVVCAPTYPTCYLLRLSELNNPMR